eukprot:TRINITY_DN1768_c0_g1_i7.p2 TRINITY_DN1768_c0_g1~~TRINITY_DN1768_c0_g1_i7.p2  ORF type:complete len:241 (-),score=0.62 TRINITY_DN1768_c0_g1_i7:997-1719(-)
MRGGTVVDEEGHFETPSGVNLEMAVHEPNPWIVRPPSDRRPSACRHSDCIPFWWIHQIELQGVSLRVVIAHSPPHHEEIEAMQMDRVAVRSQKACILQHQLHARVERQTRYSRALRRHEVLRRLPRVVERLRRIVREVRRKHTRDVEIVCLQQRHIRHYEADVVYRRDRPRPVQASRTRVQRETHSKEELLVQAMRHPRRILRRVKAAQTTAEVRHKCTVVDGRYHRQNYLTVGVGGFVV